MGSDSIDRNTGWGRRQSKGASFAFVTSLVVLALRYNACMCSHYEPVKNRNKLKDRFKVDDPCVV
jgi:hypothetical protein